jgi:hypothetical protein
MNSWMGDRPNERGGTNAAQYPSTSSLAVYNRFYESNGPSVKVRGPASLIAEKCQQLACDAQTSGDLIAAEGFLQHAEHYNRLFAAAQE